jgi:hypothetical protein
MMAQTPGEKIENKLPPFDPDPWAVDHLEGNKREIRRYRRAAMADHLKALAQQRTGG